MRFENPQYLNWILIVPVYWFFAVWFFRSGQKKLAKSLGQRLTPFLTSSLSSRKLAWKRFFRGMALLFLFLALARPQMGASTQEVKSEGVELIIMVDVSDSMMAEDVRPNRLTQAKAEMSRLVELMPQNKTGVVAFAGSAVLLSPLTTDPAALKMYLESLSPSSVSQQGTNFKDALDSAREAFERGGKTPDAVTQVTRVILIASDGEDQEQGAIEEAKKMADQGTRIFSLAYGTEKGAPIPERDQLGFLRGYKKDRSGQTVLTQVHGDALKALAEAGRGSFHFAVFGGDHLKKITEEIDQLEKTQFESSLAVQYDEYFQWFLSFAFMFLCFDLLINERKPAGKIWKGRFEVSPR